MKDRKRFITLAGALDDAMRGSINVSLISSGD
jgi:hypothetical protein